MRQMKEVLHGLKPVSIMVFIQFTIAGLNVFYKLAAKDGMNLRILVAYCWIFGAAFMIPLALIFERRNRPQLTWTVICQSFFCGLSGKPNESKVQCPTSPRRKKEGELINVDQVLNNL
ncbi:WAT1-related protein At1g25270-like isoform X3 [Jatropha curcas]|uniref:WAT1-related protein At1g25270-like isoform X3 n=1 Tax=Jatropha curcas TaxID=180498 RepID=UPI0018946200|nr:WAT1-related protein At1g25270-like isoform X3 [Jatropha curcas]